MVTYSRSPWKTQVTRNITRQEVMAELAHSREDIICGPDRPVSGTVANKPTIREREDDTQ